MDRLRERIDNFLDELEQERLQIDLANRRRPQLGALYRKYADLFSTQRITEVQRILAGSGGGEEKRIRSLLEFLGRGHAKCQAAEQLDQLLSWEVFGAVPVGENRIPVRQIPGALGVASDRERRGRIAEANYDTLEEQGYLAEDYLAKQREAIGELGYGTHVEAMQVLGSIDLQAIARKGERFIADTETMYRELLGRYVREMLDIEPEVATAADGTRLQAATRFDRFFTGSERHRQTLESLRSIGVDPLAYGRITVDWEAYLGIAMAGSCRPVRIPEDIRLLVTPRAGRPAAESFLASYGLAFHAAFTDKELSIEGRRLGDESVPYATSGIFRSLLRNRAFLNRIYGMSDNDVDEFLGLSILSALLDIRREVARLRFELAWYSGEGSGENYAAIFGEATGLIHDPRMAVWEIDGEFSSARKLRAAQLTGILVSTLRSRFGEDWFRNPDSGAFLLSLGQNGRRYSAPELSVQLSSGQLSYRPLIDHFEEMVS